MRSLVLGCAFIVIITPAVAQRRNVPRGSFLQVPARTTKALLQQFDTNPTVSGRYMKIFGRSREESREILARLKPKPLTQSHDLPVAFYSNSGKWTYKEKQLSRGSVVYITPEGKPFLKEDCGNPLVLSLPYPKGKSVASQPPIRVPMSLERTNVSVTVTPQPSPEALFPPAGEMAATTTPSPAAEELAVPEGELGLVPGESPGEIAQPGVSSSEAFPFWIVLFIPFLFLGGGGSGIGGGGPPPPVIPESATWTLMINAGLGIAVCVLRDRANRSKQRRHGAE